MFCVNCGAKLKDNALFCSACGRKIAQPNPVGASGMPLRPETVRPAPQPVMQQPVMRPAPQPAMQQPVMRPIPQPVMQPTYQPVAQPAPQPVMQPTYQSVAQPAPQPVMQPTYQPVAQPAPQPVMQPIYQPVAQPAPQPAVQNSLQPQMAEEAPAPVVTMPVLETVAPVEEVAPMEEAAPIAEVGPTEENAPVEEVISEEEIAPVAEEAPVEEEAPVAETVPVAEEAAPIVFVQEEEPAPLVFAPAEEPAPIVFHPAPVAAEPAPYAPNPAPYAPNPAPFVPTPAPAPVVSVPTPAPVVHTAKKPAKQLRYERRKPHIAVRILMQLLSLILSLLLSVSVVATVALADVNHLMSGDGMKQIINTVLMPSNSAPQRVTPNAGAAGGQTALADTQLPGNVNINDIPDDLLNGDSPEETLDNLIDWIYEEIDKSSSSPVPYTKEQVKEFVAESTIPDFVAEKLAGFAEDFINDTEKTTITADEIIELLEENEDLIEETLDIKMTSEVKKNMKKTVEKVVEDNDLNTVIREQVFVSVQQSIDKSMAETGMSWEDIQPKLQWLCSDMALYIAIGVCLVLLLLLCLVNYYNVPAGLTWAAVFSMIFGVVLTVPLILLQMFPNIFSFIPKAISSMIASFAGILLPIHGMVLLAGVVLLVISIIWRVIRSAVYRKRLNAAMA